MRKIFSLKDDNQDDKQVVIDILDSTLVHPEETYLLNTVQQIVPSKNFFVEIRGILDVEHLLDRAVMLLDIDDADINDIIRKMVNAIPNELDTILYSEVQKAVFSHSDLDNVKLTSIRQKLQGINVQSDNIIIDQSWLTIYCSLPYIQHRHLCFARMNLPTNFGTGLGDIQFILLIIAPIYEKDTKSALETARTFSTLFCYSNLRQKLLDVQTKEAFINDINIIVDKLAFEIPSDETYNNDNKQDKNYVWYPCKGIINDFKRRLKCYKSDYIDGVNNIRSIYKTISTAVFLYFSILPTVIALGMLNDDNTNGLITVKKEILAQCIAGLIFGFFGGQLFLIMLSTAPISIYIEVIHEISKNGGYDFYKMFTTTGLWCSVFLIILAVFEASKIMKYAKRSLEELFGLFIAIALIYKAITAIVEGLSYYKCTIDPDTDIMICDYSSGLLFILLVAGTLWISMTLYNFRTTPYLNRSKREILADYALPIGVIIMSFIGSFCFKGIPKDSFTYDAESNPLTIVAFWDQSWQAHLICLGLGIPLSILFFMDQLIVTNTVDNTQNNLKKGEAPNWDLFVVALMNIILSILGLPWAHGALPQAFLHLKAQADVEDRLVNGSMQQIIIKNRESRVATLIAHIMMIPTYFFLIPYLQLIPTAVFHGLFLYLAFTSMIGNELCERSLLLFTEQRSYPPFHYIRRVPQRIIHIFTLIELIQLIILCFVGFSPWPVLEMAFPIITFLFIPFRSLVLPYFFKQQHLEALDNVH